MKIKLIKIGRTPLDFEVKSDEIIFKGYLEYYADKLILLKAKLNGFVKTQCSQCGKEVEVAQNEDVEFYISDGAYDDTNNLAIDIVESFDSQADLDELLKSEIELIKSDYHSCQDCR
ncbi:hypothetical protein [Sulfurimonas sp.]|uniref:hypothetical protein n=1 Tax=Sulfurimonas sp. TaxID=2022749 RepID=UPI002B487973|nr:hypothetical protein [Sulfurimonas sp.]